MRFDDEKRCRLLNAYEKLGAVDKYICRVLAAVSAPTNKTNFTRLLNRLGGRWCYEVEQKWSPNSVKDALEKLVKAKVLRSVKGNATDRWCCERLIIETLCRQSAQSGELAAFCDAIDETGIDGNLNYRHGDRGDNKYLYASAFIYAREIRKALYGNDWEQLEAMMTHGRFPHDNDVECQAYGYKREWPVLLEVLFNPFDEELLISMPSDGMLLSRVLLFALDHMEDKPRERLAVLGIIRRVLSRRPDSPGMLNLESLCLIDEGKFSKAEALSSAISGAGGPDAAYYMRKALLHIVNGRYDEALDGFNEALKVLRRATKKRNIAFYPWFGVLYPLLMLRAGDRSDKIIKYCDMAVEAGSKASAAYEMISAYASVSGKKRLLDADFAKAIEDRGRPIEAFVLFMLAGLVDSDEARRFAPMAAKACELLLAAGRLFPAADLASLIRKIAPGNADAFRALAEPAHPLGGILKRTEPWRDSLTALAEVAGGSREGSSAQGRKRVVWKIFWLTDISNRVHSLEITPVEQSFGARGWSAGRDISLSRLKYKPESVTGLTEQDKKALAVIRERSGWSGVDYYIDEDLILERLAGHPLLLTADGGKRVTVRSDEPTLFVTEENGAYKMTFTPYPSEEDMDRGAIITEVAENELRVSRFDDRHIRIAEIVGPNGIAIPDAGLEAATATMGLLASVVTVHSDMEIVGSDVETVSADDRLCVMMSPSGDGLEVEVVTRPLGNGTTPCKPGAGGGSVFGARDERRVRASRDLKREAEALGGLISSCAALREADQLADNRWRLDDSSLSLEFLLQLQELEGLVVAEWPKGQSMSVRKLDPSRVSMSVKGAGDWFSVSGKFEVNEDLALGMKEMLKLLETSRGRFITIGKNQFVALTEAFKRRLGDMAAFGEPRGDELRLHHLSAAALGSILDDEGISHGAAWEDVRAKIAEAEDARFLPPPDFKCDMRDYQAEGFAWMMRLAHWGAGACLADDMGLGKTIQALAVLLARAPGGPALVVAPTSVCANWISEAAKFTPTLRLIELRGGDRQSLVSSVGPMDVLIATYGLLQNELELVSGVRWRTIVLDEAQAIKNIGTKRSAAAMKLEGDFKIVTTGTPVENNLSELWNIFRFINPGYLGSHENFTRKFAAPIERDGDASARKRLKRLIAPFVLRRTKASVLSELPPKTEITLEVELREAERALYEAVRRNALDELDASGADDKRFMVFAQLVKLRRACCNSSLVKGSPGAMESAKLEAFTELIGEITSGGHKALVFSQFVDHLAILRARLDELGTIYQYLDGSTPPAEREARVKKFQSGDGDCFLISLKAGGVGLNLTAADYVIHMDPWWNPAVEEQASDRTHRIGQERPVTVFRIVAKGTIEEKIVSLHAWKKDLAESLLDESSAPSRISTDELIDIIRGDAR